MVMCGMDNSFLQPNCCSNVSNLCFQPCHLKDWEMQVHFKIHGQGKKNLNGDGMAIWYTKERMQKGRNKRTSKHNIYLSGISHIHLLSLLCLLLQALYLETWTTSPAWACSWTRIPTRRSISRYAHTKPPRCYMWLKTNKLARASVSHAETLLQRFEKGLCVLLCNHSATGAEEKVHTPHTGNRLLESQTEI